MRVGGKILLLVVFRMFLCTNSAAVTQICLLQKEDSANGRGSNKNIFENY